MCLLAKGFFPIHSFNKIRREFAKPSVANNEILPHRLHLQIRGEGQRLRAGTFFTDHCPTH